MASSQQHFDNLVRLMKEWYASIGKPLSESEAIEATRNLIRYHEISEEVARRQIENYDQDMIDHFKKVLAGYKKGDPESVSLINMAAKVNEVDHQTILKAINEYLISHFQLRK